MTAGTDDPSADRAADRAADDRAADDRVEGLATRFARCRPRLERVAYALLGSRAEAEDAASRTWLRLAEADRRDPVDDVEAWCVVAVARIALDELRSARVRRESYVGPWLPEPDVRLPSSLVPVGGGAGDRGDPADRVTLDDTVRFALLVVLESLSPAERTSWVLHDLFGMPFDEVAAVVGRSPQAVRQLASRARAHLAARGPRFDVDRAEHDRVVTGFLAATAGGDLAAMVAALDPQAVLTSDGAGQVSAARRPVVGADRVARFLLGLLAKAAPGDRVQPLEVNGLAGVAAYRDGRPDAVFAFTVEDGRIARIDIVRAPAKLTLVPAPGEA